MLLLMMLVMTVKSKDDDADVENETLAVVRAVPTKAKAW